MTIKPVTFQFPSKQAAQAFVLKVIAMRPACTPRQNGSRVTCRERFAIQMAQRVATPLPASEIEEFTV